MPGPPLVDAALALETTLSFPYGTGSDNLLMYGPVTSATNIFSGGLDYDNTNIYETINAYLAQTWLQTAARHKGNPIGVIPSQHGTHFLTSGTAQIRAATVVVGSADVGPAIYGGTDGYWDLGFYAFGLNGSFGPLHKWTSTTAYLVSDVQAADALWLFPKDQSMLYTVTLYGLDTVDSGIQVDNQKINPGIDDWSGLGRATGPASPTAVGLDALIQTPVVHGTNLQYGQANQFGGVYDFITTIGGGPHVTSMLAYMSDIWQTSVCPGQGEHTEFLALPGGESTPEGSHRIIKTAQMVLGGTTTGNRFSYGTTGVKYFGLWRPVYWRGQGDVMFLDSQAPVMIPKYPGCRSLWIYLFGGVTAALTMITSDAEGLGLSTPNGPVRLLDGITDGLILNA